MKPFPDNHDPLLAPGLFLAWLITLAAWVLVLTAS